VQTSIFKDFGIWDMCSYQCGTEDARSRNLSATRSVGGWH